MKSIVILAGGRFKKSTNNQASQCRQRFMEIIKGKPCISHVIDACKKVTDIKKYVVISNKNIIFKTFLQQQHPEITILESPDYTMLSSLKVGHNADSNDKLILCADIWNLKTENIEKFLNSKYKSALYRLKHPWGNDLISSNKQHIRRGDIGHSVMLLANEHLNKYLSEDNINKAIYFSKLFHPNRVYNNELGNHLWTWIDYVFFCDIWGCKDHSINHIGAERGTIYIEDLIYLDND